VYRIDLLWQVARDQSADVALADIQGSWGIKGMSDFYTVAEVLNIAGGVHSGTELGVLQAAKVHVVAAHPEVIHAGDAMYYEYVDDVLVGGKLECRDGEMRVPQDPGLGIALDEQKLAQYELTQAKHKEYDEFWAHIKRQFKIPPAGPDLLVRHF